MHKAENKSNKVVVLATYGVAVLCLLLGLLLPLFNGKELLALKLGEVFKSLLKKENTFGLAYPISLFGMGKAFDITAVFLVLYTAVTALAVLAVIPIALSVRKDGKLAKRFYYGIEISAVIVISLYFVSIIFAYGFAFKDLIGYNLVLAGVGTMLALLALTGLDKGKKAAVKIVLSVLSVIAFIALIDVLSFSLKLSEKFEGKKIALGLSTHGNGIGYINAFFTTKLTDTLKVFQGKEKILYLVSAIASTVVLLNFIIDTIKLATRKYKKGSILFDIVRYGLEIVLAVIVLVLVLICKYNIGLMLIAVLVASAIQLTIVIVKYISALRRKAARRTEPEDEIAVEDTYAYRAAEPLLLADGSEEPVIYEQPAEEVYEQPAEDVTSEEPAEEGAEPETETVAESEPTTPVPPVPDEDGYVDPELDAMYQQQLLETKEAEENLGDIEDEDLEDVELYEPGPNTTYLTNSGTPDEEAEEEQSEEVEEPSEEAEEEQPEEVEPVEEVTEEPTEEAEEEQPEEVEPVEEVAEELSEEAEEEQPEEVEPVEEPVVEPVEEVAAAEAGEIEPIEEVEEPVQEQPDDGLEEPAQNPFREVKPYNPYEKHNNPFKQFEEPPQPYNPYRQQQPAQYEKPQPARPAYEPKRYEQPERPVRPLQPRPIIQEFKPVPPVSEQPQKESRIYTIDTLYAGPIDDFIRKLSNDERIEFAKTFLEKNRGSLGSIPDYVVGGDNKKFFSATFIYLGRIRGMVSDSLLNKMYKEINLL